MFPLFETIAIEYGKPLNLHLHQQRYERSLLQFYSTNIVPFSLAEILQQQTALFIHSPLIRCRIDYNAEKYQLQCFPYERKPYRTFQPVICDHIDYSLKYADRQLLNQLVAQKGECDEIIIIKQGKVTDCSIGNLIFRKGKQWVTSDSPLLKGTQREFLLQQGKIHETTIFLSDLSQFEEIRLINSLNGL